MLGVPLLLALLLHVGPPAAAQDANWPSFRGWHARGVAEGYATPTRWDVDSAEHVKWKTPILGLGNSSPIVWGTLVCVTTALGEATPGLKVGVYGDIASVSDQSHHTWKVLCLNKDTGEIVWERTARTGVPSIKRHPKSTHANSTLATDGTHVVAFLGSEGLYCYDMQGQLLWTRDFGVLDSGFFQVPDAQWEFGSSPIIHDNLVIVQADVQQGSFLAALSIDDGSEVWRTERQDLPTWSTPTIHESGGHATLIVNGYRHIGGYDARTGEEIWRMTGGGDIPIPTPIVADDLIFITNAHGAMAPIYAIRANATGDISLTENERSNRYVAWSWPRDGSYILTPIVYGGYLYNSRWNGVLGVYDMRSGERLYQQRLAGGRSAFTASPVAADGKIYFASEDGSVFVVKAGPEFELLAENSMGEVLMASPAISEGVLFFRTEGHLVAIANDAR